MQALFDLALGPSSVWEDRLSPLNFHHPLFCFSGLLGNPSDGYGGKVSVQGQW